jgi:methionyl-tRNA formyltransferase
LEIGIGPWPGGRAAPPGSVVEASPQKGLWVAAKDGPVEVKTVQPEGKKAMSAREFLRGFPVRVGAFVE